MAQVARFKANFDSLPMIYNSMIRRDLIDELRNKVGRCSVEPMSILASHLRTSQNLLKCQRSDECRRTLRTQ